MRRLDPVDAPRAWEALLTARKLVTKTSEREKANIEALAARYRPEAVADRAELDRAYADAMREVAPRFPEDTDAVTLCTEGSSPPAHPMNCHRPPSLTRMSV